MARTINLCLLSDFISLILGSDGNVLCYDFCGGYMTISFSEHMDTLVRNCVLKTGKLFCV